MKTDSEGDNIIQNVPLSVALSDPRCKWHDPIKKIDTHRYPEHTVCVIYTRFSGDSQVSILKLQKKHHQTTHIIALP